MDEIKNNFPSESINAQGKRGKSLFAIIAAIIIGAWIIGMSVLAAGWLISRQIAENKVTGVQDQSGSGRIAVKIPQNLSNQGNADSKVTVIEFADFQCPFCGEWHNNIYPKLKAEYIDTNKINFIFWDFAFLGPESYKASEAALCAKEQGRFWEYHDHLYVNQSGEEQGAFSDENLKKFAPTVGLDISKFNECFDSRKYMEQVESVGVAAGEYGINSTPTVLINGLKLEGIMPYESFKNIIDAELAK